MQANEGTFTGEGRRGQIVAAAIETIAELGYGKASFAQIAKRAGLSSTGLISYHFRNKKELVEQVLVTLYREIRDLTESRLKEQPTPGAALRAYIESNVDLAAHHPTEMKALMDIFMSGTLDYDASAERESLSPLEDILRWGQASGEFREFDVRVMATSIQRSVEGPAFLLAGGDALDFEAYTRELVTLFERATAGEG